MQSTVEDPGFSRGGANSQRGCANLFFFGRKLYENERGARVPGTPLISATGVDVVLVADPGFPCIHLNLAMGILVEFSSKISCRGGSRILPRRGATYDFAKFSKKA